jgi:hypothetical protein
MDQRVQTSLPPGWKVEKIDRGIFRVVTPDGTVVPIVDSPLVGTDEERAALATLNAWKRGDRWQ